MHWGPRVITSTRAAQVVSVRQLRFGLIVHTEAGGKNTAGTEEKGSRVSPRPGPHSRRTRKRVGSTHGCRRRWSRPCAVERCELMWRAPQRQGGEEDEAARRHRVWSPVSRVASASARARPLRRSSPVPGSSSASCHHPGDQSLAGSPWNRTRGKGDGCLSSGGAEGAAPQKHLLLAGGRPSPVDDQSA